MATLISLNLKGLNFLVADASADFRRIVMKILRDFGAKGVAQAGSADEVQALLGRETYDLLMIDAQLPGTDGLALTRALRGSGNPHRQVPIVILAGHAPRGLVERARDSGASMVMAKPVSPRLIYQHLVWAASSERAFVETEHYAGPDRRFRADGRADGTGRRAGDPPAGPTDKSA